MHLTATVFRTRYRIPLVSESCRETWHEGGCVVAGWVTEGVSAFDELSGSAPVSIRQQALRGLAKIALERNDTVAAKAQYERILGKALMGRGRPAEHWAHSEYAWLVFEDGDLQVWKHLPMTIFRAVLICVQSVGPLQPSLAH